MPALPHMHKQDHILSGSHRKTFANYFHNDGDFQIRSEEKIEDETPYLERC